jgi:poly(hydroxyalkanoate) depolymerase family esterase
MELHERLLAQMREATELLRTSGPAAATAAIQSALRGASGGSAPRAGTPHAGWSPSMLPPVMSVDGTSDPSIAHATPEATERLGGLRKPRSRSRKGGPARQRGDVVEVDAPVHRQGTGSFLTASHTSQAGTRAYKLYVPSSYSEQALPLIVMLHGCKQNPDDFAAGTGMNEIAEKNRCLVLYPAQARAANGSNCWNWFKSEDQHRDHGEPSILADMTRDVMRQYHIDPNRVYVAGLSAGGAMAAIMGASYPELYAAVGIHSGLPVGAAHDLPSAFAAMRSGTGKKPSHDSGRPIPVIVFHGDRDTTVHPRNGEEALAQFISGNEHPITVEEGEVPSGRSYTRTIRRNRNGEPVAEQWIVHGAGHAWSGGDPSGSYTDPEGPSASAEMVRFFYRHVRSER